jgi:hypothetical protein
VNTGAKHFAGLKITQDRGANAKLPGLKLIRCRKGVDHFMFESFGEVGWAGNGGFHAINLAFQFGARVVIGLGFDMSLDHGYHWHGRHDPGLNNPSQASVERWRQTLDSQRPALDRMGLEFIVGSPNSRLTAFRKLGFLEAIDYAQNRIAQGALKPSAAA